MKCRSRFLELAQSDLLEVVDYLAQYSLNAANDFLDELDERLSQICKFPKLGTIYRSRPTIRRVIVDRYLIFYEADEKNKLIKVYRILHSSRNIEAINLLGNKDDK